MNQHLRYVIIFAVCMILCNQCVHLFHLYKDKKNQYVHLQNNMITGAVYEFNMKSMNIDNGNSISFDASNNKLVYRINKQIKSFQLSAKDNIWQISEQSHYDIRDPQSWTLKNFYTYLLTKLDSMHIKNLSMQFVIQDNTGRITDSYPKYHESLPFLPEYIEPLGFISKDTLHATYNYPFILFIQSAIWQIIITIIITISFTICIINLYQTIRNAKKSGEYRELFIHNLVHDLKQPIENQIKTCYIIPTLPLSEQKSLLERSQKQLNEILQFINRMLLQFTDAHGLQLTVREFNLKETLEALTQRDRWSCKTNIQFDFRSENPIITGDYHFLFAVFQNIIDNSLKYSGDQANVQITCTDPDAQHVQIRIEDNGSGISSKNLKHVFERFYRGDYQSNRDIKGHGQGLHYARIVILTHGGTINIESEKGKGTTIIVTLPRNANVKNKHKQ